ncbi:hypothetical protein [Pseudoduganella sp. OTU4001]|uniref:hypothetical protein n=1 Tax=Pseudoduganella sp. OTU4001 TaxID=3043854 RepID=UPI00313E3F59
MDPAIEQYVDANMALYDARSDAKLAEFRAVMEAYTARADERAAAARDREESTAAATREREQIRANEVERRMADHEMTVKSVRRAIYTSAFAGTIAIAALNAASFVGIMSLFDVGRNFGTTHAEMQQAMREMRAFLEENARAQK